MGLVSDVAYSMRESQRRPCHVLGGPSHLREPFLTKALVSNAPSMEKKSKRAVLLFVRDEGLAEMTATGRVQFRRYLPSQAGLYAVSRSPENCPCDRDEPSTTRFMTLAHLVMTTA